MLESLHPFALSLIIGLLIGVEREYHEREHKQPLGVRTFTLIALTGTLAAYLKNTILAAVIAGVTFALIGLGYWRTTRSREKNTDIGMTTEFAAVVTFCTGYIVLHDTRLGGLIGLCTLALLVSRSWMHRFVREKLRRNELTAATTLIVAIFGVSPFLPDRTIDPLGLINPRSLMVLFCAIGLIQFSGYAAMRIFGTRAGLALSGFLGGIVSSTAVFLSLGETLTRNAGQARSVFAHALLAVTATLLELAAILSLASPPLVTRLAPAIATMIILSAMMAAIALFRQKSHSAESTPRDPLNVIAVLKLGLLLFALIASVNLVHRWFSDAGLWLIAAVSGSFELHGVSMAIAVDLKQSAISADSAAIAVMVAIGASFVSKSLLVLFRVRHALRWAIIAALACLAAAGSTAMLLLK